MAQEKLNINTETVSNLLEEQVAELHKNFKTIKGALFNAKEVLTLEEAAIFLGMSKSSLYKMTHNKVLPYYRPNGKMVYFEKSDNIIMNLNKK